MVTRSLFGFKATATGSWCGRTDLNPHGPCGPTDFHTLLRLSPPPTAFAMGFGVWTIPSPCPDLRPGPCFFTAGCDRSRCRDVGGGVQPGSLSQHSPSQDHPPTAPPSLFLYSLPQNPPH